MKKISTNRENMGGEAHKDTIFNDRIKVPSIQVIDFDGTNHGVMDTRRALDLAESKGLDLVVVSEAGALGVPIAKIINLNKKLYEDKKKNTLARKKQHEVQLKELRFSIKIGENDMKVKVKQAAAFVMEGLRVKIVLVLKGREKSLKDTLGVELFNKIENALREATASSGKVLASEGDSDIALGWMKIYFLKK